MASGRKLGLVMLENDDVPVLPVIRQAQIIEELSALLPERVRGEWARLVLTSSDLSMYGESQLKVQRSDGSWGTAPSPRAKSKLLMELRKVMYRPGVGTWFSTTWTLTKDDAGQVSADVSFNYDEEPDWDPLMSPIDPGLYGIDLEDFPRDDEHIPGWLRERLDEAQRAAK